MFDSIIAKISQPRSATGPRSPRRRTRAIAIAGVLAVGFALAAAGSASAAEYPVIVPKTSNAASSGPLVVAIGDSIMAGHGLPSSEAWLALLAQNDDFRLTNLASDGSGFVTVGDNNDTFADQIEAAIDLKPQVVILSGSSNDLGQSDVAIAAATSAAINLLHLRLPNAQIITVSAVWGDTTVPFQMKAIAADVVVATRAVGGTYLRIGQPLAGKAVLLQGDDVHPTAAGQAVLAAAVNRALAKAAITL